MACGPTVITRPAPGSSRSRPTTCPARTAVSASTEGELTLWSSLSFWGPLFCLHAVAGVCLTGELSVLVCPFGILSCWGPPFCLHAVAGVCFRRELSVLLCPLGVLFCLHAVVLLLLLLLLFLGGLSVLVLLVPLSCLHAVVGVCCRGNSLFLFVPFGVLCLYAVACFRGIKTLCSCHLDSSVYLHPVAGGGVSFGGSSLFLFVSTLLLVPPPPQPHTHTHKPTDVYTHTHMYTHTHTHTHTDTHIGTHAFSPSLSTHTHTHTLTRIYVRTHSLSLSLSLTHTHFVPSVYCTAGNGSRKTRTEQRVEEQTQAKCHE